MSLIYNFDRLASALQDMSLISNYKISIGATTPVNKYFFDQARDVEMEPMDDINKIVNSLEDDEDAIDAYMSSAAHAR